MICRVALVALVAISALPSNAHAGLYYSGESVADLPSLWRGFLIDQRMLRGIAIKPAAKVQASPARLRYLEEADKLEKAARSGKLSADEQADLGAIYVRLGELDKAIEVLRNGFREHPNQFHLAANLGTAWQLQGDLDQASAALTQAIRLAPEKQKKVEEFQLKLVRGRQRRAPAAATLDDLFGVRYVNDAGQFEPGVMAESERKKLPKDAAAIVQELALWLPADGLLLWQLAELANAYGDVRMAAAMLDGCVTEYAMSAAELRQHRQLTRSAADELAKKTPRGGDDAKAAHENHVGGMAPRSKRPLNVRLDQAPLPPIRANAVNPLPWSIVAETSVDRAFKPTFAKHLQQLDDKQITMSGYMQPFGEDLEVNSFMFIEYPVGCWFCETPDINNIMLVELPSGKTTDLTRGRIKITGKLKLNASDPENFLYTVSQAKVEEED